MPLVVVVELRHSFMALNNGLVMVVLTIRLCVVITGKSAFFWVWSQSAYRAGAGAASQQDLLAVRVVLTCTFFSDENYLPRHRGLREKPPVSSV